MLGDSWAKLDLKAVSGIGRRDLLGREFAHVASLRFLKLSVKVVRHKNGISCCGRLWRTSVSPVRGLAHHRVSVRIGVRPVPGFPHLHLRLPPFAKSAKDGPPYCIADVGKIKSLGHPPRNDSAAESVPESRAIGRGSVRCARKAIGGNTSK